MTRDNKAIRLVLKYALILAILYFIGRFLWIDRVQIVQYFEHVGFIFYGSVLALSIFLFIQAWIWSGLLNTPIRQLGIFRGTTIYVNSQFAKYLPGAIWNLVGRMMLAGKYGATFSAQVKSIYYENVLLAAVAGTYGLLLFVKLEFVVWPVLIALCMAVWIIYRYYDVIGGWIERFIHRHVSKLAQVKLIFPRSAFFASFLYYLVSHLFMGIAFWLLLLSFGVSNIDMIEAAGIYALAWLLGLASPLPGGLGLREGALTFLLALQIDWELAYRVAIIARLWSLLAEILIFCVLNVADYIGRRVRLIWQ
ncbi:MAG: lysylphosphatidylglycerol synthase domain-containing protein [Paenibacillaceae bacterium]